MTRKPAQYDALGVKVDRIRYRSVDALQLAPGMVVKTGGRCYAITRWLDKPGERHGRRAAVSSSAGEPDGCLPFYGDSFYDVRADTIPAGLMPPAILRVLGADDWLIFARREDGVLVYTVIEVDPAWLDAPHRGQADFGTAGWRADWTFMLRRVAVHPDRYQWHECDHDTDGTYLGWPESDDDAFVTRSRALHVTGELREEG